MFQWSHLCICDPSPTDLWRLVCSICIIVYTTTVHLDIRSWVSVASIISTEMHLFVFNSKKPSSTWSCFQSLTEQSKSSSTQSPSSSSWQASNGQNIACQR
ncbi:hypothetical protein T4C_5027 [Trichinella pseudospiralis]|uniref:Uncharacterized protein n=1 Tax=Trichinella pseudospiralis TaxID=6337 RepID=A0A0V1JWT1_TRIPS|nr:hypothetical protein T4C_5027 [Trichinella pseudospiralis]